MVGGPIQPVSLVISKPIFFDGLGGGIFGDADAEILRSRGGMRAGDGGQGGEVLTAGRQVGGWSDRTSRPNPGSANT